MRVLFVIDSLYAGGAEQSLSAMVPTLVDRGVDVAVATLRPGGDHAEEIRAQRVTLIEHDALNLRERVQAIRHTVRSLEPDVVHTTLYDADLAGRLATLGLDVPVSTTLTTTRYDADWRKGLPRWKAEVVRWTESLSSRRCDRIHAVSETVATTMSSALHYPRRRIDVVPRGRDPQQLGRRTPQRRARVRGDLGVPGDESVLITVGRHEKVKGHDVAIRAFASSGLADSGAVLFVVGRAGGASLALGELVKELGVAANVRFLGHRSDVADLMVGADVLVSASRREGLPGTLIEAQALELPVVASDLPQIREVVGDTARLVPVDDHHTFGVELSAVLDGTAPVATRDGRERFERLFTLDAAVTGLLEHWRAVGAPA